MENVSVKFQENVLKKIDRAIKKHNFNSRTEFLREAVRDKIAHLTKEEVLEEFFKLRGKGKLDLTDEEIERRRIEAGEEIFEEFRGKHR